MINKNSRYTKCKIYEDEEKIYFGRRKPVKYKKSNDDRYHTIIDGERLDLIAHKYLGASELWWIIAEYNNINFPLQIPEAGTVLRIPSNEKNSYGNIKVDQLLIMSPHSYYFYYLFIF